MHLREEFEAAAALASRVEGPQTNCNIEMSCPSGDGAPF